MKFITCDVNRFHLLLADLHAFGVTVAINLAADLQTASRRRGADELHDHLSGKPPGQSSTALRLCVRSISSPISCRAIESVRPLLVQLIARAAKGEIPSDCPERGTRACRPPFVQCRTVERQTKVPSRPSNRMVAHSIIDVREPQVSPSLSHPNRGVAALQLRERRGGLPVSPQAARHPR